MLIAVMPADIAVEFTVGNVLNASKSALSDAIPFFAAVIGIASLPLIVYFIAGKQGHSKLQKMNTWLNTHGYIINVVVLGVFIYMILK
jgi:hypothetical protein